jgi:hypothetical protein
MSALSIRDDDDAQTKFQKSNPISETRRFVFGHVLHHAMFGLGKLFYISLLYIPSLWN